MRIDEIVNSIQGLGVELEEKEIVEKVIRSLPMIYNPNISTLEYREDLDKITIEELYGILIAYEMRIGKDNSQMREVDFKTSEVPKKYKTKIQSEYFDDEEALLVKNIKTGIGKYKRKLPLKCFKTGGIGDFASEFPYLKHEDDYEHPKDSKKNKIIFNKNKKKTFYSWE